MNETTQAYMKAKLGKNKTMRMKYWAHSSHTQGFPTLKPSRNSQLTAILIFIKDGTN